MSSIEAPEPGTAEDQTYFRALEEQFLALRGQATLLSPADWQVAIGWRRSGIPIELVVQVMVEMTARQRARRSKRGISSLRYFRAGVEAAWDERLELTAGGTRPAVDSGPALDDRLAALAAALPESAPDRVEWTRRISELSGTMEELEEKLVELDSELLHRLEQQLDQEVGAQLRAQVDSAIERVDATLTAEEREGLRGRLRAQAIRRATGTPLLSLFAPEAMGPAPEPER